jgi:hypothetical protein
VGAVQAAPWRGKAHPSARCRGAYALLPMSGAGLGGALVGATQLQALRDPHCGHLFVFRGKRGGLIKVLWHDGQGLWPVGQAPGARPHRMAAHRGRGGDDHAGAAWLSAGRHRLAIAAAVMAA